MTIRRWAGVLASLVPLAGCSGPPQGGTSSWAVTMGTDSPPDAPTYLSAGVPEVYYVAAVGSDRNPGTAAAPFKTIQRAADIAGPGDTVIVRPGIYTGASRIVSLETSGEPDAWITFRSERNRAAVLDGRSGRSQEGWYFGSGVGYVRVEGFELRDLQEHGFDFYGGRVHDIAVVRNLVHHVGRNCTDTSNGRTGASLGAGAHRITFDGNVWHDIGRYKPGENGCAPRTRNYQNHDHGIYVADANEITIRNNVFRAFGRGWAIHRYSSSGSPSQKLLIQHNTFVGANPYREGQIILASPTGDLKIENNIFYRPKTAAIYFEDLDFVGALVRNNMIYGGGIRFGRPGGVTFSRNWENTDPRLVSGTDLRLQATSPAINAGLPLAEVAHDALGAMRPKGGGYDLGAYER
jgi:hypothetical protein